MFPPDHADIFGEVVVWSGIRNIDDRTAGSDRETISRHRQSWILCLERTGIHSQVLPAGEIVRYLWQFGSSRSHAKRTDDIGTDQISVAESQRVYAIMGKIRVQGE